MVDILYDRNLITIALNQVLYRSVGGIKTSYMVIAGMNMKYLSYFLFAVLLITVIYLTINAMKDRKIARLDKVIPYFIISIIPFVWFFIIRDHSFNHAFFTYRILILTIIGLPIGFYYMFENKVDKEEKDNIINGEK